MRKIIYLSLFAVLFSLTFVSAGSITTIDLGNGYYDKIFYHDTETLYEGVTIFKDLFLDTHMVTWMKDNVSDIRDEIDNNPDYIGYSQINLTINRIYDEGDGDLYIDIVSQEKYINWTESAFPVSQIKSYTIDGFGQSYTTSNGWNDLDITDEGISNGLWNGDYWIAIMFTDYDNYGTDQDAYENNDYFRTGSNGRVPNDAEAKWYSDDSVNSPNMTYVLNYKNCTINPTGVSKLPCDCTFDTPQSTTGTLEFYPVYDGGSGIINFSQGITYAGHSGARYLNLGDSCRVYGLGDI